MLSTKAYAAQSANSPVAPFQIDRREPRPHDVLFDVLYCGICHTDIHMTRGQFPGVMFPMVPGHEVVGKVVRVGSAVTKYKIGDIVGVGCMVDSCRVCSECEAGEEQFCNGIVATYSGYERDGKTVTYGGYSTQMTVDEKYVLKVSPKLSPAGAAPLLCAGITTYSPLRHWKVGKGSKVGVIGLGGLGARSFAVTKNEETFTRLAGQFDIILNTVSASVNYDAYVSLLKRDGTLVLLGIPDGPVSVNAFGLLMQRRSVAASPIGGIRETQEMLDFCAEHGIESDIETISIDEVNEAYERILKSDVRYRFVIDMASLR